MKVLGLNCIAQEFVSESDEFFYTFNPKENSPNSFKIFKANKEHAEKAICMAKSCALEFSFLPREKRAVFLLRIGTLLLENQSALCTMYCLESGLPEDRAELELKRTVKQLEEFAAALTDDNFLSGIHDTADSHRFPSPKPSLDKHFVALGPVVVFGASNFPFAYSTIGGDTASALAAGCPVIVKSHAYHAGTGDLVSQILVQAAEETGMPKGVFSNLNDDSYVIGQFLVEHPDTKAVGFTGSFSGGMSLFKLAANRKEPIPVFAEMGSVNPLFIFESAFQQADLAKKIAVSISLNAGQFCTNPGLIFLRKSKKSRLFIDELCEHLKNVPAQTMLHPSIFNHYISNTQKAENNSIEKLVSTKEISLNQVYPVLKKMRLKAFAENAFFQEEVFGSHTIIVELDDDSEFHAVVSLLKGQLTVSIFCSDSDLKEKSNFLKMMTSIAGRIIFNGVPTGVEVSHAMHHGGPFPATTDARFTAVGRDAVFRFLRPVCYQNFSSEIRALLHN